MSDVNDNQPPPPATDGKPQWRDRTFRMRAIAAVAVASVIIGAAGGALTTALVVDHDDHGGHGRGPRIEQEWHPGAPGIPPGGDEFPGRSSGGTDGQDDGQADQGDAQS